MPPRDSGEAAKPMHAMNVQIPELDWHRAKEAAEIDDRVKNASDVMRLALSEFLENHPHAGHIAEFGQLGLEHAQEVAKRREAVRAQIEGPTSKSEI